MKIGEAARASGVSAKMIRYYESIDLIPTAGRTQAGYRRYGAREVQILRFVRRARDLGFPVATIAELLALWSDRARQSADVKRLALDHVGALERKIADMRAMALTLRQLADLCSGDERPDCPILNDLEGAEGSAPDPGMRGQQPL